VNGDTKSYNFNGKDYPVIGSATYRANKLRFNKSNPVLEKFLRAVFDPGQEGVRNGGTYDIITESQIAKKRSMIRIIINGEPALFDGAFFDIIRKR